MPWQPLDTDMPRMPASNDSRPLGQTAPGKGPCLIRQEPESEMCDRPYYQVARLDFPALKAELAVLPDSSLCVARVYGLDIESSRALTGLGFRKMCVQTLFATGLAGHQPDLTALPVVDLDLDEDSLNRHASNFRFSNFSFDPNFSTEAWAKCNRWCIKRHLADHTAFKFALKSGFVSFRVGEGKAIIDLISVLEARQGIGAALMAKVLDFCAAQGLAWVEVVTDCENLTACLFYQKMGFLLFGSIGVFHFHQSARQRTRGSKGVQHGRSFSHS